MSDERVSNAEGDSPLDCQVGEVGSEGGSEAAAGARILAFPVRDDPPLRDVLGDVLRDERLRQGRTLTDVAEEAAVSVQYLSEIERGRKEVSSELLEHMHTALGLDLAQVLERATDRLRVGTQRGPVALAA